MTPVTAGSSLRLIARTVGVTAVLVAGLAAFGVLRYGSTRHAMAALRGTPLVADADVKGFGRLRIGESAAVDFELRNMTGRTIHVLGARTSCSCVSPGPVPFDLPPGGRRTLRLIVTAPPRVEGPFEQGVWLFTDQANQQRIELHVVGTVSQRS